MNAFVLHEMHVLKKLKKKTDHTRVRDMCPCGTPLTALPLRTKVENVDLQAGSGFESNSKLLIGSCAQTCMSELFITVFPY